MSFLSYWPLLLLAAIPYFWWVQRRTLTDLSAQHLKIATGVRSAAVILLVGALMQPVWTRNGRWLSVIYALDVSQSVSPEEIASAMNWIREAERTGNPDHSAFIPFGANALLFDDLAEIRQVQVAEVPTDGAIDQSKTNLDAALDLASRSFAPEHLERLVLLTDGNANAGRMRPTLLRLGREGVRVFTRPLGTRVGPDAWIEEVRTPRTAVEGELFPLEAQVFSQAAGPAVLRIRAGDGGEISETRDVDLVQGINRIAFETESRQTGPLAIEAVLEAEWDRFPGNNLFRQSLAIQGPPRVLYAEGRSESAVYLRTALELETIDVDVVPPSGIPRSAGELDAYEAVILSDVRADAMTPEQMEAMAVYVGDLGGGLILAGGESVFGEDGYSQTRLEEILPVRFDIEREPPTVALIIVLDKSGSMGGQKLELVKEASKAAVDVLRDDQLIGLVAFDYNHYWPFQLQPAANRDSINQSISTIVAGGETNIFPALREAHEVLQDNDAEIRHVILLSDGRSLPDDFRTLVEEMADAGETVSTVAVGNGADRELLADIAGWGGGREYFIEDATRVPQVFAEETELATRGTLREAPFRPVVLKEIEAFRGVGLEEAPPLRGYVSTLSKDTSEVLLGSDDSEDAKPILARWRYGLGKTVAFTSDVKDRWAADWLTWEGYGRFWPQLVRETMRRQDSGDLDLEIARDGDSAEIRITALDSEGGFRSGLDLEVRVVDPLGETSVIAPHQIGPGTWLARFDLDQTGPYVINVDGGGFRASRSLPYSYPDEYHLYPPDLDLLRDISLETGGVFDPDAAEIFRTDGESTRRSWPLWPYLAFASLILYLVDLLLRRVRLFDAET